MSDSIFSDFTGLYSLSKTLRFELRPVWETREYLKLDKLEKEKLFPKDREKAINYQRIKYYIDLLHGDFIQKSLSRDGKIDFTKYFENFKKGGKSEDANNDFKKEIVKKFVYEKKEEENQRFKDFLTKKGEKISGKLFSKEIIDVLKNSFYQEEDEIYQKKLKKENGNEESEKIKIDKVTEENQITLDKPTKDEKTIFDNFRGFTTYFSNFHENRKNLYKTDGKAGRIATRIIDENLPRFCANIVDFQYFTEKYPELLKKFDKGWKDYFKEKKLDQEKGIKEFLGGDAKWEKYFAVNFFNNCLTQEDINTYNYILRKLNKDINEFKQQLKSQEKEQKKNNQEESKQKGDKKKLSNFKELYKQILGEVKKKSDFIEVDIKNIGSHLEDFIEHSGQKKKESENVFNSFLKQESCDKIYLSSRAINTISSRWFTSWDFFGGKILEYLKSDAVDKNKKLGKDKKKLPDFVSMGDIKNLLESDELQEIDKGEIFRKDYLEDLVQRDHWNNFLKIWKTEFQNLCDDYKEAKDNLEKIISELKDENLEFVKDEQKLIIKSFADCSLNLYQMTKYFAVIKKGKNIEDEAKYPKNDVFYNLVDGCLFGVGEGYIENQIFPYYNALRNFLTKKPWSEEKMKLNFENGVLGGGWDQNQEPKKYCVILEKDQKYFLGIYDKRHRNSIFRKEAKNSSSDRIEDAYDLKEGEAFYNKIEYKAIADAQKDISLLLSRASKENLQKFNPSDEINKIKKDGSFKSTNKNFNIENLHKLINYYRETIPKYDNWKYYNFEFKDTEEYRNINEFTDNIARFGYKIWFDQVSEEYIDDKLRVKDGKEEPEFYLFEIFNKDFSKTTTGNENIHTKYFKMLFEDENLKNPVLKLSGGAELFFREETDKDKLGHRKDKQGNRRKFIDKRDDNKEKEVVKHRRYAENKMFLHLPIVLNFGAGQYANVNQMFNNLLVKNENNILDKIKIIGIDRGEKHLAYYSVIDTKGNVLDQGSFNKIYQYDKEGDSILRPKKIVNPIKNEKGEIENYELRETGEKVPYTDYHTLLDYKEKKRLVERQSWTAIENIKELKNGYISHVVHQLCELIFKYLEEGGVPPVIVFENLNTGFKQGRQKIDKQIYQKLELKLAQKLNYLTKKNKKNTDLGGTLNALQLAPEVKNFGSDIEKQSQVGTIFYVDPSYTSTTCPNCGFRKRLTKTKYESVKQVKEKFFEVEKDQKGNITNISDPKIRISHENEKYKFEFTATQKNKKNEEPKVITDVVYSDVERLYWNRNNKNMEKIKNVTTQLDEILGEYKNGDINEQIKNINDASFWKKLVWCLHLILQIRNSENKKTFWDKEKDEIREDGQDRDFLQCPHCHFHSENPETWQDFTNKITDEYRNNCEKRGEKEEFNGDANGAYNTARKWLIQLDKIRKYPEILSQFKQKWKIDEFPKNKDDKKEIIIEGQKYILSLEGREFQLKKKGVKKKEKIEEGKKISRYPDLFVSNQDWDNFATK